MAKKFKKTERVGENEPTREKISPSGIEGESLSTKTITSENQTSSGSLTNEPETDLSKILAESKANLEQAPIKRKRRTKSEMEASRGASVQSVQSQIDFNNLPEQDFTMASEPLLTALDRWASGFVAKGHKINPKDLRSSPDDIAKAAKGLNKPLTILNAHHGGSMNPVTGAYIAIGMTLGGMFLGKQFQLEELANGNSAS